MDKFNKLLVVAVLVIIYCNYSKAQGISVKFDQGKIPAVFDKNDDYTEEADNGEGILSTTFREEVVPKMDGKRKGQNGKIGIIGGSLEYTGAPYFSAISALKVGADLVYVITSDKAGQVIKTYSPELIVYPILNEEDALPIIETILKKLDVIVIGPGLGRENSIVQRVTDIINICKANYIPLVIDADGLYIVSKNISMLRNYPGVILTPNILELQRLEATMDISMGLQQLGANVFVLNKGANDIFTSSKREYNWKLSGSGSGRRAGGQGDILAGALGTFFSWSMKYYCFNEEYKQKCGPISASIASFAASKLTRQSNEIGFAELGRSMIATDMIEKIHTVFANSYEKTEL